MPTRRSWFDRLRDWLCARLCLCGQPTVPTPVILNILARGESNMAGLKYTANLGPPGAPDVASREVTLTVNGTATVTSLLPAAVSFDFVVPRGAQCTFSIVDIDGDGNRSQPASQSFTATDTFPPPAPTIVNITETGEEV